MLTPLQCIALRTVKVSDSRNLLSVWTRQAGRLTLAMPAGNSREARRRRALTGPLALFEGVCDLRDGREISSIRDISAMPGSPALASSPQATLTAMFLAEFLDAFLRQAAPDPLLSDYIFTSVARLGTLQGEEALNFHIVFIFGLLALSGISPDSTDYRPGELFDMRDGRFRATPPLHNDFLDAADTHRMLFLVRYGFHGAALLHLGREGRNRILDLQLRYISIHLAPLPQLKSLDILRSM